ncbi:ribonuclease P protein component [Candidatus Wolfebacteria bacterium RIFCSPLOWO2_01_FULL_38_11]|uniref:Ribonuclease P protein component n=2 Tax=Candidatus Wolfeibacteriota TaxID=1752735 RepID=A0A0G0FWM3_9BACT|nr:MAG: Ribonuclease P protein component [Candidatus Wolfebacteria bacterium GW2011_GWC1_37_10]OGM90354.1 MAG: ribonuclease P protein component [Candidatus Wolfebacteria bacterium RIFCSPLOWO2_01_FULL_38_11]
MLAKKFRLPIQQWFKEKRKFITRKSDFFIVRVSSNNLPYSRFGAIISLKVSKSAVLRNKIKRAIFNFIYSKKLHEVPGKDILISVLPKASELTKQELEEKLKSLIPIY